MFFVADDGGLIDDLDTAEARAHSEGGRLVRACTLQAEGYSKAFCPVDTGALVNSIGSTITARPGVIEGEWGSDLYYARYVNDGTRHMAPRPYIDRAADLIEPVFYAGVQALAEGLGDVDG